MKQTEIEKHNTKVQEKLFQLEKELEEEHNKELEKVITVYESKMQNLSMASNQEVENLKALNQSLKNQNEQLIKEERFRPAHSDNQDKL